jgi:hypothetical protein
MKNIFFLIAICLINFSCKQIMVREYESPLDYQFFQSADCKRHDDGSYTYHKENISYTLTSNQLSKSINGELEWSKDRVEILYPYGYLELAVPYMLRDGMRKEEILNLLGKTSRPPSRFLHYKLSNGSELALFKGTLNMPKGMKNITIQGLQFNDDFKLPTLK